MWNNHPDYCSTCNHNWKLSSCLIFVCGFFSIFINREQLNCLSLLIYLSRGLLHFSYKRMEQSCLAPIYLAWKSLPLNPTVRLLPPTVTPKDLEDSECSVKGLEDAVTVTPHFNAMAVGRGNHLCYIGTYLCSCIGVGKVMPNPVCTEHRKLH